MAVVPMAGVPMAGVPMAGVPIAEDPIAGDECFRLLWALTDRSTNLSPDVLLISNLLVRSGFYLISVSNVSTFNNNLLILYHVW